MYKVLVCGGRHYANKGLVYAVLDNALKAYGDEMFLIQGGATGADALAAQWALDNGVEQRSYPAPWGTHGNAAGMVRNKQMVDENPDLVLVIAFPGGRGTADMIKRARDRDVPVEVITEIATNGLHPF